MSSNVEIVNIGFISAGDTVSVPITACNSDAENVVDQAYVEITEPSGLTYVSSNMERGVYSSLTNVWTIGTLGSGECIIGQLTYTVDDPPLKEYEFEYTISSDLDCGNCDASSGCVKLQAFPFDGGGGGPSLFTNSIANDFPLIVGPDGTYSANVTTTNDPCPDSGVVDYEFIDTTNLKGVVFGTGPDSFTFFSPPGYCGQQVTKYRMICDGEMVAVANVSLNSTCGYASSYEEEVVNTGGTYSFNIADAAVPCFYGATTKYILADHPSSDGSGFGLRFDGEGDVRITSYSQDTGDITIEFTGAFTGTLTETFYVECRTESGTMVYQSKLYDITLIIT